MSQASYQLLYTNKSHLLRKLGNKVNMLEGTCYLYNEHRDECSCGQGDLVRRDTGRGPIVMKTDVQCQFS